MIACAVSVDLVVVWPEGTYLCSCAFSNKLCGCRGVLHADSILPASPSSREELMTKASWMQSKRRKRGKMMEGKQRKEEGVLLMQRGDKATRIEGEK